MTSDERRVTTREKKSIVSAKIEGRDITRDIFVVDTCCKDTIIRAHHGNGHYQRDILVVTQRETDRQRERERKKEKTKGKKKDKI